MQTYYSGKIQEITTKEWRDGMQNLWNMTLNWHTSLGRKMDEQILYQDALTMIKAITTTKDWWCYHPNSSAKYTTNTSTRRRRGPPCQMTKGNYQKNRRNTHPPQELREVKKQIQTMEKN